MSRLKALANRASSPAVIDNSPSTLTTPQKSHHHRHPTTYHRKFKALVNELRSTMAGYQEAVGPEGQLWRAAQGLVNMGTQIDNTLATEPGPSRAPIIPAYEALVQYRQAMNDALSKIHKLLQKLRLLVDTSEQLLFEALTLKDPEFSLEWAFWDVLAPGVEALEAEENEALPIPIRSTGTWTMKQLVESLSPCPSLHAEHLASLDALLDRLRDPERFVVTTSSSSSTGDAHGSGSVRIGPDHGVDDGGKAPQNDTVAAAAAVSFDDSGKLPYDRQALFEVQRMALESISDLAARSELASWRDEWEELMESEMQGYELSEEVAGGGGGGLKSTMGGNSPVSASPKPSSGGGSNPRRRRGGSVEP